MCVWEVGIGVLQTEREREVRDEVRLEREREEGDRAVRDEVRLVGAEHVGVPVCRAVISVFQSAPRPLAAA